MIKELRYEDVNKELPSISLNWMIDLLRKHYSFPSEPHKVSEAEPKGLAHLSISDSRGSRGSDCRDRKLPESITKDPSIKERENAGPVPLSVYVEGAYQTKETEQENINCDYITQQKWTTKKWDRDE